MNLSIGGGSRGRFDPIKPDPIRELDNYSRMRTDSVRAWVDEEEVGLTTVCSTHKDAAYQTYAEWVRRNGMVPKSAPRFWSSLDHVLPGLTTDGRVYENGKRVRTCNVLLPT